MPIISRVTLFLLLAGMATALARLRRPADGFLLLWWFLAFLPVSFAVFVWSRRMMINLPATMLLAGLGLLTLLDLLLDALPLKRSHPLALAALLGFFLWYGADNWHTYFTVINRDPTLLNMQNANYVNGIRAVRDQYDKAPFYLATFRKTNSDYWSDFTPSRTLNDHSVFLNKIPQVHCQETRDYFTQGGLFGALQAAPEGAGTPADVMVLLTPFHRYLTPLLTEVLGGDIADEVQPTESTAASIRDFFRVDGNVTDRQIGRLYQNLNDTTIGAILAAAPNDFIVMTYVDEGKDIAFSKASPGQQASALLELLLRQSAGTLIIDQPEDDLDNRVIMRIVQLIRTSKNSRQLIFATHNPNIMVNGDADKVVALKAGDPVVGNTPENPRVELFLDGAIETPPVREAITHIMEGGKDAFDLRSRKYRFDRH